MAGGLATRFPGKLDACVGEQTMLERVVAAMRACSDEIVLAVGSEENLALARRFGLPGVLDAVAARGPLGAALSAAPHVHAPWIFLAPADAPLLDRRFVDRLWAARMDGDDAIVARDEAGMTHPLPAFYRHAALDREAPAVFAAGRRSLRALLERLAVRTIDVTGEAALTNVNTPDDLRALGAPIVSRCPHDG